MLVFEEEVLLVYSGAIIVMFTKCFSFWALESAHGKTTLFGFFSFRLSIFSLPQVNVYAYASQ